MASTLFFRLATLTLLMSTVGFAHQLCTNLGECVSPSQTTGPPHYFQLTFPTSTEYHNGEHVDLCKRVHVAKLPACIQLQAGNQLGQWSQSVHSPNSKYSPRLSTIVSGFPKRLCLDCSATLNIDRASRQGVTHSTSSVQRAPPGLPPPSLFVAPLPTPLWGAVPQLQTSRSRPTSHR
jgi:hypothetical protein